MRTRSFFAALIFSAAILGCSYAAALKTLPIETGADKIIAYEKSTGNVRWQSTLTTTKTNFNGKPFIYTEEQGKGRYGKDNSYKTWITRGYYQIGSDALTPYEVKLEMKDAAGNPAFMLDKSYNYAEKKVVCDVNGAEKTFDLNPNTLDRDIMGRLLPNFPFESGEDTKFYLITHEPALYSITMKLRGKETITVKGKEVECYKLELIPDLGALGFVGAFVPKNYFWYTVSKPHRFMRYEGLESGIGTPVIVMESDK